MSHQTRDPVMDLFEDSADESAEALGMMSVSDPSALDEIPAEGWELTCEFDLDQDENATIPINNISANASASDPAISKEDEKEHEEEEEEEDDEMTPQTVHVDENAEEVESTEMTEPLIQQQQQPPISTHAERLFSGEEEGEEENEEEEEESDNIVERLLKEQEVDISDYLEQPERISSQMKNVDDLDPAIHEHILYTFQKISALHSHGVSELLDPEIREILEKEEQTKPSKSSTLDTLRETEKIGSIGLIASGASLALTLAPILMQISPLLVEKIIPQILSAGPALAAKLPQILAPVIPLLKIQNLRATLGTLQKGAGKVINARNLEAIINTINTLNETAAGTANAVSAITNTGTMVTGLAGQTLNEIKNQLAKRDALLAGGNPNSTSMQPLTSSMQTAVNAQQQQQQRSNDLVRQLTEMIGTRMQVSEPLSLEEAEQQQRHSTGIPPYISYDDEEEEDECCNFAY